MAETLQQLDDLHARLDAMLAYQRQQTIALEVSVAEGNPAIPDQFEAVYAGLDDNREDRAEYRELDDLGPLHERVDALQHAQEHERDREQQGMGY